MSFLDDTYCQLCERFITKEQWNKHLYSSRHLHKKAYGYTSAYFPQRRLTGDESIKLEKAFWKMFFARDIKEVEEFWYTYFMMTANMKDYSLKENEDEVRKVFRDTMEGQFEHNLYNKSFSNQFESDDENVTLQERIEWWMTVVDRGGSIPDNAYEYNSSDLFSLYRKVIDPEMQDLTKEFRDRHII